jgi:predicted nucleic acid-binding protein
VAPLAFFDTNVFLYGDDARYPKKRARALDLIDRHQRANAMVVSLQVLQEYFAVATGKLKVDPGLAQRKVELLAQGRVVRFSEADVIASIELHRLNRISFWDAMIVHAARLAGAGMLFSEDLQAGREFAGVRVVNPFE